MLVQRELVSDEDILGGEITICCVHGDVVSSPLAAVKISLIGEDIIVQAGISGMLPASALLGWDIPQLMSLVSREGSSLERVRDKSQNEALAVITRRQQRDKESIGLSDPQDKQAPSTIAEDPSTIQAAGGDIVFNFDDSLFSPPGRQRNTLTRAQRRTNNRQHVSELPQDAVRPPNALDTSAKELRALQNEDETLQRVCQAADGNLSMAAGSVFFHRDRLLYRRYHPPGCGSDESQDIEQLVLPAKCRQAVVKLAHDIPMAGHLGKHKTVSRLQQRFYWPGLFRDVNNHCKSCEQCQKSSPWGVKKAARSSSGKRFILVICDYATRYPEAMPLRTVDANHIAEELVQFFAPVGVPEEILTD